MIPVNILAQLLPALELNVQPSAPIQSLNDRLSDLIPGQRVQAEIQALLPNGAYRAMIGQREVTLALSHGAKPGDTLELEVVDNNGKLALAVNAQGEGATPTEGAPTNLSPTGRFIATLFSENQTSGKPSTQTFTLNGGQPIIAETATPIASGKLAPLLQQAVQQSGLFYEAHQYQWLNGEYSEQQLRQEPQGKLAPLPLPPQTINPGNYTSADTPAIVSNVETAPADIADETIAKAELPPVPNNRATAQEAVALPPTNTSIAVSSDAAASNSATHAAKNAENSIISPATTPLVQQQLNTLGNPVLLWQGQIWPGQQMQWEIVEEDGHQSTATENEEGPRWRTRLQLDLPRLGAVDIRIALHNNLLQLDVDATQESTREALRQFAPNLQKSLSEAQLQLASFAVHKPDQQPPPEKAEV